MNSPSSDQVDAVLEYRFPGMTEEIELTLMALAKELNAEETNPAVLRALIHKFDLDIRDRNNPEMWGDGPKSITALSFTGRDEEVRIWVQTAREYRAELEEMEERELFERYKIAAAPYSARVAAIHKRMDSRRFFNRPAADADYQYWLKLPVWTIEEAVALSLGKDPSVLTGQSLDSVTETSPFKKLFTDRLSTARRFVQAKILSEPTKPTKFIEWASKQPDFEFPSSMNEITSTKRIHSEVESINRNLETSYLKLILGLTMVNYDFDPNPKEHERSRVYKEIEVAIKKKGIFLHDDTIGDIIKAAALKFTGGYWKK